MVEKEIYDFKVPRAEVEFDGRGLTVRLFYPSLNQLEEISSRLPEQLDFGISVFEQLLREGKAVAAVPSFPLKPSSGGSMYILEDNAIVCHRRDKGAGVHKLYHSPNGGYAKSREFTHTLKGLEATALAETAEECLLITRDKNSEGKPWLVVPEESEEETLKRAQLFKIDLPIRKIKSEILEGRDRLEVYENNLPLFKAEKVCISVVYESVTSLSTLWPRKLPLHGNEVVPIDTEGMEKQGKFIHFNREAYLIPLEEIVNKKFGTPLNKFEVYQLDKVESGIPQVKTPFYSQPYLGPEGVAVTNPHIWAPEDMMVNCLRSLDVAGYRGSDGLQLELEKIKSRKDNRSLVPREYLVNS